ncbi:MAG: 1-acyl-sn-glycerol-3-phosphate acyltransferase [Clostridia bacterium]|nr:1-acyl-sn-glycerol-3-phosphate acyltransferase [Clostridia bacterium]
MSYDPQTNRFPYPKETDRHYLEVKKDRGIVFDRKYPYIDESPAFRFWDGFVRFMLTILVFPLARIRMGLKIEGRENLKKHRAVIEKGVVSCCNHVHMWDYIAIMCAIRPHKPRILVWAPNVNGENGWMIRHTGGIPIPETGVGATLEYMKAVKKFLGEGGWLHVYPEGSMWEYYAPVRPFKHGAAYIACTNEKPILPMAYSYREPGWIRKRIFGQIARLTLRIGEPLLPDPELAGREREEELTRRCHAEICRLAGIDPAKNPYPPVFRNSERVDYYTETYGVGYRGSH